jgi:CBS domain-containing protein
MKVQDLLTGKNWPVHFIAGNRSVDAAIVVMSDQNASALIVTENDQPVGIFAERDVFRCCLRNKTTALSKITVQRAMTDTLITAEPEDGVRSAITIMMTAGIKHLPVVEEKKIIGILKLSDLVEHQLESLNVEIHQLKDYIEDLHEAGMD